MADLKTFSKNFRKDLGDDEDQPSHFTSIMKLLTPEPTQPVLAEAKPTPKPLDQTATDFFKKMRK